MQYVVGSAISRCLICKTYCSTNCNAGLKLLLLLGKEKEIGSLFSFVGASEIDRILLCSKQMCYRVVGESGDSKCVTTQVQIRADQTDFINYAHGKRTLAWHLPFCAPSSAKRLQRPNASTLSENKR